MPTGQIIRTGNPTWIVFRQAWPSHLTTGDNARDQYAVGIPREAEKARGSAHRTFERSGRPRPSLHGTERQLPRLSVLHEADFQCGEMAWAKALAFGGARADFQVGSGLVESASAELGGFRRIR